MTKIPNWDKVKRVNKRARRITSLANKERIRNVGKNIIEKYKIPIYKKHVIKDDHGNVIRTEVIPITRKYKGHIKIRKRKMMNYKDFKKHYVVISKYDNRNLNLAVHIANLIISINKLESKSTNLGKITKGYENRLKILKSNQNNFDQQTKNSDQDMNKDQDSQNDGTDLDKKKDQDSDHHTNFGDQNLDPNNPNDSNFPPVTPGN